MASLAASLGMEPSLIKFVVGLFLSCVIAIPNRFLPNATARHFYSVVTGYLLLQFIFGASWIHIPFVAGVVYVFTAATLKIRALNRWRHWISALFSFGYLTAMHYRRLFTIVHAGSIDILAVQMVLTLKLYTFAYNLMDGQMSEKYNKEIGAHLAVATDPSSDDKKKKDADRKIRVLRDRVDRGITSLPMPWEFAGYVLNPVTSLVGPAFEIKEYLYAQARDHHALETSRYGAAAWKLATGVFYMGVNMWIGAHYQVPAIWPLARDGKITGVLEHLWYAHVALTGTRCGYYFVWKAAEAASVLAGFGLKPLKHNGKDKEGENGNGNGKGGEADILRGVSSIVTGWRSVFPFSWLVGATHWDGVANVSIVDVEAMPSLQLVMRAWNMHTQSWLERYFFLRNPPAYNKWVTLMASAFWHGLFPGYYMCFITAAAVTSISSTITGAFKPLAYGPGLPTAIKVVYELVAFVLTQAMLDFALSAFNQYTWEASYGSWVHWKFYGIWGPVVLYVLARGILMVRKGGKRGSSGKGKGEAPASAAVSSGDAVAAGVTAKKEN